MKYLDEYRSEELAQKIVAEIHRTVTKPWILMEVCGGQTHSIVKYGIDRLLPKSVELVHGPGCPVARYGFRTYDLLHVASALLLGCDAFWSFDLQASRLAKLEGLRTIALGRL